MSIDKDIHTNLIESYQQISEAEIGKGRVGPAKAKKREVGSASQEANIAKQVRQAVYDIRYRARRENIPLAKAFSQYMSNTSMGPQARALVKQKLIGEQVELIDEKKLTSNEMSKREEIVKSMKDKASEFEKRYPGRGKEVMYATATKMAKKVAEALDPVGKEDGDVDNDGDKDKSDKYLLNRRKAIGNAIQSQKGAPSGKSKVRVTDKASGKSYVRFATDQKIEALRRNPKIQSVERTEHGEPYEGERKSGELTAKVKSGKGLKDHFSDWRSDLNIQELSEKK